MKTISLVSFIICIQIQTRWATVDRTALATELFQKIAARKEHENVIFSPASVQTILALLFFGANGLTATEMRKTLKLGDGAPLEIAQNFADFIDSFSGNAKTKNSVQLRLANRIYANDNTGIKPEFNSFADKYFHAQAEQLNFYKPAQAIKKINNWVELQTDHKIKELLNENIIDQDTRAVLVNAIYFKARWQTPFERQSTEKANFMVGGNKKVKVDMMHLEDEFPYANLRDLNAKAVELPYNNSKLSMMLLLPNKRDGLKELELKLAGKNLTKIAARLKKSTDEVFIPKFRIEFGMDLKSSLKELGLKTIFSRCADFSKIFTTSYEVSEVQHKAYIEVDEDGSEAAAATALSVIPSSLTSYKRKRIIFRADHPFVFVIRSSTVVYFVGHVTKF